MENTQPTFQDLIAKLPISETEKQGLLDRLAQNGEEAVKPEIKNIMEQAGQLVEYQQEVEAIAKSAEQEISQIQQDAHEQYMQASKEIDELELEETRNTIQEQ